YRHIRDLFMQMEVKNVKFIWCPNSMSIPQEPWNDIQLAYPGNDYVDYIGLDIYNGAGKSTFWKTFISEGIENYFLATQNYPDKPIIICETASIERNNSEKDKGQSKAEWIEQMAVSLKHEMQKVRILCWFNESDNFKINSTRETTKAFYKYVLSDEYFNSGMDNLYKVLRK
ncbi:MAG: glycosyl hydrolase, partial [Bacteroidota bacterium]